jgi:hypothetical protein
MMCLHDGTGVLCMEYHGVREIWHTGWRDDLFWVCWVNGSNGWENTRVFATGRAAPLAALAYYTGRCVVA